LVEPDVPELRSRFVLVAPDFVEPPEPDLALADPEEREVPRRSMPRLDLLGRRELKDCEDRLEDLVRSHEAAARSMALP
jgi:hypothetical protein